MVLMISSHSLYTYDFLRISKALLYLAFFLLVCSTMLYPDLLYMIPFTYVEYYLLSSLPLKAIFFQFCTSLTTDVSVFLAIGPPASSLSFSYSRPVHVFLSTSLYISRPLLSYQDCISLCYIIMLGLKKRGECHTKVSVKQVSGRHLLN